MKNTIMKFLAIAVLVLGCVGFASAQTSLTQTTLSSDVTVGPSGSASGVGSGGNYVSQVSLTSGTGVTIALNGQPVTMLYVGGELMGVLTNPFSTTYTVLRGLNGTKVSAHPSGDMVLIQNINPQTGGNTGSGGFQSTDPPYNGKCTAANTLVTPWVNVLTGHQFICSTITTTWVPGFDNPDPKGATTLVASVAGATLPSGPLFHISGTNAITSWTIPVGCNATPEGQCSFTVIPDAAFTTVAGNNIATSDTAVANLPIIFIWDPVNSKFVSLQSK